MLSEAGYPCGRGELLAALRGAGADDRLLARLDTVPDRIYEGPDEVMMFTEDAESTALDEDVAEATGPDPTDTGR
ncbi:DUF2795 domain-containing protein [Rhodococcus sp. D2-41]|nr:DUF2795 domain-containing protein [Rhodococcus sp. D2-41]